MSSSMRWRSGLTDEQGAVRVGWDIGACSKMTVIHHAGSPARTRSTVHRRSAPALNLPEGPIPRSGFVLGRKAECPVLDIGCPSRVRHMTRRSRDAEGAELELPTPR